MKTFVIAGGLGLLAALAAAPAAAQTAPAYVVGQVRVAHGDLDLATADGAAAMLARLTDAAAQACGRAPRLALSDPLEAAKLRAYRLCKVAALEAATLELDAPLVRIGWLESSEAIRYRAAAQRTTAQVQRLAAADRAVPSRN